MAGYLADFESLDWSRPQFGKLIERVARELPGARIHLVAHSLGNRALMDTLADLVRMGTGSTKFTIGEIVFLAPDIDRAIFLGDLAPALAQFPGHKTLYVSAEDFPLMASATVMEYPRLGDSRSGVPLADGIDTVDVSDAITILDGHGYYESDQDTIEDLYWLIRHTTPAAKRPGLVPAESDGHRYWKLRPAD